MRIKFNAVTRDHAGSAVITIPIAFVRSGMVSINKKYKIVLEEARESQT